MTLVSTGAACCTGSKPCRNGETGDLCICNKEYPSFFSLEGRVIDFSEEQLQKAKRSMVVIASSSSTLVREEHPEKEESPRYRTFLEKEIFSRAVQLLNALD